MQFSHAVSVICILWVAAELYLQVFHRAADVTLDRGSLRVLLGTLCISVPPALLAFTLEIGALPWSPLPEILGFIFLVGGLSLRLWAVLTLGPLFTVTVTTPTPHSLVRTGPYALLRHPSYTGLISALLGIGLVSVNWLSTIIYVLPLTLALLHRIRVEESLLIRALPAEYPEYMRSTPALLPRFRARRDTAA